VRTVWPIAIASAVLAAGAPPAHAAWSRRQPMAISQYADVALAVNRHGDVAVAWSSPPTGGGLPARYHTTIYVSFGDPRGRVVTRRVWTTAREREWRLAVGLDQRGAATVAWVTQTRRQARAGRYGTLRAAFGTARGPWSAAQRLAGAAGGPRMALDAAGETLLSWEAARATVAWRAPGDRFGRPHALARPRLSPASDDDDTLTPLFDADGRAYLDASCDPAVALSAPHVHRFSRTAVLSSAAGHGISFGVTRHGDGVASWISGRCAGGRTPDGALQAAVLHGGAFAAPFALGPPDQRVDSVVAVPAPGGGGIVTWSGSGPDWLQSRVGPRGEQTAAQPVDDPAPFLLDAGGDLALNDLEFAPAPTDVVIRPKGGGPDAPAPGFDGVLAVPPTGRVFALLTTRNGEPFWRYAIWRP
jgi:hypothetical protein